MIRVNRSEGDIEQRGGKAWAALLLTFVVSTCPVPAAAQPDPGTARPGPADQPGPSRADFGAETASEDARRVADWVARSGDNHGRAFVIIDKVAAKVFVFDPRARLRGAAAALLGVARGDGSVAGIGQRKLADIRPSERTTPAGRFEASLGNDLDQDVLWFDYDAALSLHRVIVGTPADRRAARLASATPSDNRISFGCINVPARFYDKVVEPAFRGIVGLVYILPEVKPLGEVFQMGTVAAIGGSAATTTRNRAGE